MDLKLNKNTMALLVFLVSVAAVFIILAYIGGPTIDQYKGSKVNNFILGPDNSILNNSNTNANANNANNAQNQSQTLNNANNSNNNSNSNTNSNSGTPSSAMDKFAQCLSDKGMKLYGAFWCGHCKNQKEKFGDSAKYLPYVECSNADGSQTQICKDAGITGYPTWVYPDGTKAPGEQELSKLAQVSGCSLP